MLKYNSKFSKAVTLIFLIALLPACSSKSSKLGSTPTPISTIETRETPEQLLGRAITAQEPNKSKLYLKISQLYWQNNLIGQAKAAIEDIRYPYLTPAEKITFAQIKLELATIEDDEEQLGALLNVLETSFSRLPVDEQINVINLKLDIHRKLEQHIEAAILFAESIGLFKVDRFDEINEQIWSELKLADTSDLIQYKYGGTHYDASGWLELAKTFKLNLSNIDNQLAAISEWESLWAAHPAAITPPKEILILKSLPDVRPKQLTLALPLSGPLANVGKAIRDGFFAEFYQTRDQNNGSETIELFDTFKNDIETLYQSNNEEQSLIIGPLDKKSLSKVSELDNLSINTLALNTTPNLRQHQNLYQFGLTPESGIKQIAERLSNKNLNKVAVIAPEAEWGLRIHDTFKMALLEHQGTVIESVFYQDQASLSKNVAQLLDTQGSKDRTRKIRTILGMKLENEPRRRADIDAILMIAKPDIAKLLNPLFSFHYASDIPVYASSQIHDPQSPNKDLNGVEFIEMPWMLSSTDITKTTIKKLSPDNANKYSRFYALGADAFKLAPRLKLLSEISDSQVQGQTGLLAINNDREVVRKMQWAKFHRGKAIPIQE